MLLEIEEVNGPRQLKYKFVAGENPLDLDQNKGEKAAPAKPADKAAPAESPRPLASLESND